MDDKPYYEVVRQETRSRQALRLVADKTTTIRFVGTRPVRIVELPAEAAFLPGSCAPLPRDPRGPAPAPDQGLVGPALAGAAIVPGAGSPSALSAVAAALRQASLPDSHLLVAGHAPGEEALSGLRARALLALLLGEHAELARLCHAGHDPRDWQHVLAFLAERRGWACDPGPIAAPPGPAAGRALAAFREAFARDEGAPAGRGEGVELADWLAFGLCLDLELARLLRCTREELWPLRARVLLVGRDRSVLRAASGPVGHGLVGAAVDAPVTDTPATDAPAADAPAAATEGLFEAAVGCGAAWPIAGLRLKDSTLRADARVDLLLFGADHLPDLGCHPPGAACEWKRCAIYRKAIYKQLPLAGLDAPPPPAPAPAPPPPFEEPPAPGRTVHVLQLAEATPFVAGGALLQPGAPGDAGACLEALARAVRFAGEGRAPNLLLAVHGPDLELSRRRAEGLLAFLGGSRAEWVRFAKAHATVACFQRLLAWIAARHGWDCDPGAVDGQTGQATTDALDGFRQAWLEAGGLWLGRGFRTPQTGDWEAFFELLWGRLEELLAGASLAAVTLVAPGAVACGPRHPAGAVEVHGYLGLVDERVELLLFGAADLPADPGEPLDAVYRGTGYRAVHLDAPGDLHRLHAAVVDEAGAPVSGPGLRYEVLGAGRVLRQGPLHASGQLRHDLPEGTYAVRVLGPAPAGPPPPPAHEVTGGTLDDLLAGAYQRRGSYRADLTGFRNPDLQAWLEQACDLVGVDPRAIAQGDRTDGAPVGDSEQGAKAGLPLWLAELQAKTATATSFGTTQLLCSRLLGAFYHAYFVETIYGPAGVAMPSNVEYFLTLLGRSTKNGGATRENIGAEERPYCAYASSKAYLLGLEQYGFATTATGYSNGGPGVGHGLPVGRTGGNPAGAENVPRPGDVLDVKTALGPITGHVVTVVWAETDGLRDGTIWYVSGNAANRSVACDYLKVKDTRDGERPRSGAVSVLQRFHTHEADVAVLKGLTPAELARRGFSRLPGEHPLPSEPGAPERPPRPAPSELLLVRGDAPTSPLAAPRPATALRVALGVTSLTVADLETGGAPAADCVVSPGGAVRVAWEAQGYERLVLQPGGVDVTATTLRGQPFLDLVPATQPPGPGGAYTLEASKGGRVVSAQVRVRGILDFRVHPRAVDERSTSRSTAELVARVMTGRGAHPKYGLDSYTQADSLGAKTGSFQAYQETGDDDFKFWYWGQITPKHDARFTWSVVWPEPVRVRLTVNREARGRQMAPNPAQDVTGATRAEGGALVGAADHLSDRGQRPFFEADLELLRGEEVVASAMIRLRENYEMPGLVDFWLEHGGRRAHGTTEATFAEGDAPTASWKLAGSHSGSGLELKLLDRVTGALVHSQVLRPCKVPGGEVPASNRQDEGSRALDRPLPAGRLAAEAVLELFTTQAVVGRKKVRFLVPGPARELPPAGAPPAEIDLHLYDLDGDLLPGAEWELTVGGRTESGRAPTGVVRVDLTRFAAADVERGLELAWGARDEDGLPFEHTVFVSVDAGSDEDQAAARLHNLGFGIDRPLAENLAAFQDRLGLPVTRTLDARTADALRRVHDQGGASLELQPLSALPAATPGGF